MKYIVALLFFFSCQFTYAAEPHLFVRFIENNTMALVSSSPDNILDFYETFYDAAVPGWKHAVYGKQIRQERAMLINLMEEGKDKTGRFTLPIPLNLFNPEAFQYALDNCSATPIVVNPTPRPNRKAKLEAVPEDGPKHHPGDKDA